MFPDLRFALRQLLTSLGLTAVAILPVVLGIVANPAGVTLTSRDIKTKHAGVSPQRLRDPALPVGGLI